MSAYALGRRPSENLFGSHRVLRNGGAFGALSVSGGGGRASLSWGSTHGDAWPLARFW